ncbi:MAG: hypothetical protein M3Z05_16130 [Gemmatimonadota bacterium]|nr:hypothetical protein [Gemmatimonadota bacterium]
MSNSPTEPDGEASYVNCLLTTLAKCAVVTVTLLPGRGVPPLGQFVETDEERDWIATLPFRYENLDADKVSYMLRYLAGYRFWHLRSRMYEFTAQLATSDGLRSVRFAIGRRGGAPGGPITITRLP